MSIKVESHTNNNKEYYRLKAMRMALGLTQEELGGLVGISGVVISLHERGIIDSTYSTAIESKLNDVWELQVMKFGDWYGRYLSLQTATNLIQIWAETEGRVPENIIGYAKTCVVGFVNQ